MAAPQDPLIVRVAVQPADYPLYDELRALSPGKGSGSRADRIRVLAILGALWVRSLRDGTVTGPGVPVVSLSATTGNALRGQDNPAAHKVSPNEPSRVDQTGPAEPNPAQECAADWDLSIMG